MYKQEAERARFQRAVADHRGLSRGSGSSSRRSPIQRLTQLARVAQLTQRTNQFNFTTVRRNDGEIRRLAKSGLECRAVEVSDRFGDYGLVGVMIFSTATRRLGD